MSLIAPREEEEGRKKYTQIPSMPSQSNLYIFIICELFTSCGINTEIIVSGFRCNLRLVYTSDFVGDF